MFLAAFFWPKKRLVCTPRAVFSGCDGPLTYYLLYLPNSKSRGAALTNHSTTNESGTPNFNERLVMAAPRPKRDVGQPAILELEKALEEGNPSFGKILRLIDETMSEKDDSGDTSGYCVQDGLMYKQGKVAFMVIFKLKTCATSDLEEEWRSVLGRMLLWDERLASRAEHVSGGVKYSLLLWAKFLGSPLTPKMMAALAQTGAASSSSSLSSSNSLSSSSSSLPSSSQAPLGSKGPGSGGGGRAVKVCTPPLPIHRADDDGAASELAAAEEAIACGTYVTWRPLENDQGRTCCRIGSKSGCLCGHPLSAHAPIKRAGRPPKCQSCAGCPSFRYAPSRPEEVGQSHLPQRKNFDLQQWRARVRAKPHEYACIGCDVKVSDHGVFVEAEADRRAAGLPVGGAFKPLAESPALRQVVFGSKGKTADGGGGANHSTKK